MAVIKGVGQSDNVASQREAEEELRRLEERLWVAQAQAGKLEAFGKLVGRYEQPLLYFLRRMISDPEKAWDAYQEVWIDAWGGLGKLVAAGAFRVWIYRIAHAKASRFVAREIREREVLEELAEADVAAISEVRNEFDAEAVHLGLSQLPAEQRAALTLFYLEDMSLEEIARALDCPVGTVKSRLHNARNNLRKLLSGKEIYET